MLKPSYTKQFEKDLKRMITWGKDKNKIKQIMLSLINEDQLDREFREHKLLGIFQGRRECHIEFDWLLIYKLEPNRIIFERTGSHSDLFR